MASVLKQINTNNGLIKISKPLNVKYKQTWDVKSSQPWAILLSVDQTKFWDISTKEEHEQIKNVSSTVS